MNLIPNLPSLPPFLQTYAKVIERCSIGIDRASISPKYTEVLRREVQHLPEFHFTSAQFFLCSFTLRDVDHSAGVLNEIAARAENRMTNAANVPDGATRMHNAINHFFV